MLLLIRVIAKTEFRMLQNGFPFRNENFFRMLMAETYFLYESVGAQHVFRILTAIFVPKENEIETEFRFRSHSIRCFSVLLRWFVMASSK